MVLLPVSPLLDRHGDKIDYILHQFNREYGYHQCRLIYHDGTSGEYIVNKNSFSYGNTNEPGYGFPGEIVMDSNNRLSSLSYVWRRRKTRAS